MTGIYSRVVAAALAGWAVLAAAGALAIFGAVPLFGLVMSADLLPSLTVLLELGALAAGGYVAGRIGRPRIWTAAAVMAAGMAVADLTPYLPLNVPWLVRLAANAAEDSRYLPSLLDTLLVHGLMFGSLFAGARLSRPREAPLSVPK